MSALIQRQWLREHSMLFPGFIPMLGSRPSPTDSAFVKTTLQGLQKELAKPAHKMLPVTVERC